MHLDAMHKNQGKVLEGLFLQGLGPPIHVFSTRFSTEPVEIF
jgi:hypothetical protein